MSCRHCKRELPAARANQRYCSGACRTAAYRARKASPRRHRRSGPQVSYRRALRAARLMLIAAAPELGSDGVDAVAEMFMRKALPERQRQGLGR